MREHELRRQVVSEMHLRRWPLLQLPVAVFQWVLEVGPGEREAERSVLSALCGSQSDEENPRHLSGALSGDVGRVPRGGVGAVDPRQDQVQVRRPELAG